MKTTKKYLSLVCCAICAIATCVALVACGGGKAAKGAKMVGYWELASGKADGIELTEDDIQMMNDWGMKVVLYLGEDGKATLDLFGEVQDSPGTSRSARSATTERPARSSSPTTS